MIRSSLVSLIFSGLFLGNSLFSFAQFLDPLELTPNFRSYTIFKPGATGFNHKSDAKTRGLGFNLAFPIKEHLKIAAEFGLSLVDTLEFVEGKQVNARFNQLGVSVGYDFNPIRKFKPGAQLGYGYSYLPDLKKQGFSFNSIDIKPAVSLAYEFTNRSRLLYRLGYSFSLGENVPYNFRSEFGWSYNPFRKKRDPEAEALVNGLYEKLIQVEGDLRKEESNTDSLQSTILKQKQRLQQAAQLQDSLAQNLGVVDVLLRDNQLLREDAKYYKKKLNSLLLLNYKQWEICDEKGNVIANASTTLEEGYYTCFDPIPSAIHLDNILKSGILANASSTSIFKYNSDYKVLMFLSEDLESALKIYSSTNSEYNRRIVQVR